MQGIDKIHSGMQAWRGKVRLYRKYIMERVPYTVHSPKGIKIVIGVSE